MHSPVNPVGGGYMPMPSFVPHQPTSCPAIGHYPPSLPQAINALTPDLYRVARECHFIYGADYGAILANLLGKVSFAAAGNFRIRGHSGKAMPLALQIRFAGPPMSGKSAAHDRFSIPVIEAMKGWKTNWLFGNVTPPALLRKIRSGADFSMLSMAEGRGHLGDQVNGQLSCAYPELNDLYDGHVPAFDRADDDDDALANAPDSAIFVACVNVQNDRNRAWLDKHAQDAMESGYLYRLLMMEADQIAVEGAGGLQPEQTLLDYDHRIAELIASARVRLEALSANELPVIALMPEAEQILRQAQERFILAASPVLSPNSARVFGARLAANARRIAGCMHVFERYEGAVSGDTMIRAATIAECFGAHWLALVFPTPSIPDAVQRGRRLLDWLRCFFHRTGTASWRESDVSALAPNFGWSKTEMKAAITSICGQGLAQVMPRIENGRRVIKLELILNPVPMFQLANQVGLPNAPWLS
ncbi:DUF3987 domain-containing protein [Paraburkholderia sp. ZP32-5]|uniref:DUF3987 domain-containing protein n=1 Tax=Paraburkholderia sp. ZP32-5 TaxID=2883245 RepID=UPI001F42FCD5|nr:DUF3987 domain-containing protein [Paraburkholderia sp. ZP32-5]